LLLGGDDEVACLPACLIDWLDRSDWGFESINRGFECAVPACLINEKHTAAPCCSAYVMNRFDGGGASSAGGTDDTSGWLGPPTQALGWRSLHKVLAALLAFEIVLCPHIPNHNPLTLTHTQPMLHAQQRDGRSDEREQQHAALALGRAPSSSSNPSPIIGCRRGRASLPTSKPPDGPLPSQTLGAEPAPRHEQ
jgi:hypothetical protein